MKKSLAVKYLALLAIVLVGLFPPTVVRSTSNWGAEVTTRFRFVGSGTPKAIGDEYINEPILFWIGFAIVFMVYVFKDVDKV